MYDKNEDNKNNEKVLFKGRPNIIFSCKSIFLLFILLGVITYIAPLIISFVAEIQVYLIDILNLPLTTYATVIITLLYFFIILWIVWILLNWRATHYIITNFRVVLKKGIVIKKSYYMPFNHIQDITVSQGIINRIASVGDVIVVSAYDLTDIEFIDISNPDDIQEMIFSEMNRDYSNNNFNNVYNPHNSLNDNFKDYNNVNNLRRDSYQRKNLKNDYPYANSNFDDDYIIQNNNEDYHNETYPNYNESKNIYRKNHNRNNYLNHSVDEAMANLDKNNRFINEKQENNNYQSKEEYNVYKNHNDKFHFNKKHEYNKNNKIGKNKDNKGPSVIDIYSRKFKKHKK